MLRGRLRGAFAEQRDPVLEICVPGRGDEFENRLLPLLVGDEQQSPLGILDTAFGPVVLEEGQQGLLAGAVEALRHLLAPAAARRERTEEIPDLGKEGDPERHFESPAPGLRELDEQRQKKGGQPPRRHAVLQQPARDVGEELGKNHAVLKADPDPERHAGDHAVAIVETVLEQDPHAHHEENREEDADIRSGNRIRYRQDDRDQLGAEGEGDENRTGGDSNRARADAGQLGNRDACGVCGIRDRADAARQEIAHAVGGNGALNRAEVHGPRATP